MFSDMTPFDPSLDQFEQHLAGCAGVISRVTAAMLPTIRGLDAAQVWMTDGCRGMDEWLASRLDLELGTARRLLTLARAGDTDLESDLSEGHVTVDRASAVTGLRSAGADDATVDASYGWDLSGLRQSTARHRRLTSAEETDAFTSRFLHVQPSLDETTWRLWGQLAGVDGRIVERAIHTEADTLPDHPDISLSQARADALVSVCTEWLSGQTGGQGGVHAEIFIDAALATSTDGEAGSSVVTGPRVGPNTLSEILCSGTTRVTVTDHATRSVSTTPTSRTIPTAIRRQVLERDGHRCAIDGCVARTRLQPHHLVPFSQGGDHTPDNLVTLCWYHHHVVVHQMGRQIDPDTPPRRRRFHRPTPRAGPG